VTSIHSDIQRYIYTHIQAYMQGERGHTYIHTYWHTFSQASTHTIGQAYIQYIQARIITFGSTYHAIHTCLQIGRHPYTHTDIYIHTYMHAYMHTHTYIHADKQSYTHT